MHHCGGVIFRLLASRAKTDGPSLVLRLAPLASSDVHWKASCERRITIPRETEGAGPCEWLKKQGDPGSPVMARICMGLRLLEAACRATGGGEGRQE